MTFFAVLLFGAGALMLISAFENVPLPQTFLEVLSGNVSLGGSATGAGAATKNAASASA